MSPFVLRKSFPITPSDTADIGPVPQAISFVNSGAQTIQVTLLGDTIATQLGALPSGLYYMQVKRVLAAGTTVSNIVGYVT